jgi:hypothetical protein
VQGRSAFDDIVRLREEILAAEAAGSQASDMLLQLTPRMDSAIKRSPHVAAKDVSFSDGQMRYLGVLVTVGEVVVSKLSADASKAVRKVVEEPVAKAKPVRKTATKAAAKTKVAKAVEEEAED